MPLRSVIAIVLGLAALAGPAGCGGPQRPQRALNEPRPMDLAAVPEFTLPPGYYLSRSDDQVAVAVAGDQVRYVRLVLVGERERPDLMDTDAVAEWFAPRLRAYGWQRQGGMHWRHPRRAETLLLETGRRGKQPIIRFLIRYQAQP